MPKPARRTVRPSPLRCRPRPAQAGPIVAVRARQLRARQHGKREPLAILSSMLVPGPARKRTFGAEVFLKAPEMARYRTALMLTVTVELDAVLDKTKNCSITLHPGVAGLGRIVLDAKPVEARGSKSGAPVDGEPTDVRERVVFTASTERNRLFRFLVNRTGSRSHGVAAGKGGEAVPEFPTAITTLQFAMHSGFP